MKMQEQYANAPLPRVRNIASRYSETTATNGQEARGSISTARRGPAETVANVKEGDKAPDFVLKDGNDNSVRLSDFKKPVVLYFYPKDDTPGCTAEACNLRDNFSKLKSLVVLGVSMDSSESHKKFSEKYGLPFPLLSDPAGDV